MRAVTRWFSILPLLAGCGIVCVAGAAPQPARVAVKAELEQLMSRHGFEVRGIEQTAEAMARAEGDELVPRLRVLLEDFDYVLVQTPAGGVERIIILGEKVAYVPPPPVVIEKGAGGERSGEAPAPGEETEIVLPTQRLGSSHTVTLSLEGPNQQRVQQALLIDTGAEQVVLPASLIGSLGLAADALRGQKVQTANGEVEARIGILPAIWLGETRLADVQAAFIDDQRLGGHSLLGMNVLGRFRMTIDDENNRLTLASK